MIAKEDSYYPFLAIELSPDKNFQVILSQISSSLLCILNSQQRFQTLISQIKRWVKTAQLYLKI